jgi:hypothetical protein
MHFTSPRITQQSIVLISATEATDLSESAFGSDPSAFSYVLGAADVYTTNVSPRNGGVDYILHVDWPTGLNIAVDICVFDPADEFLIV